MKASIKFRDDDRPLVRAKVPVGVLGLPFLTGVSAGGGGGDSRDLRFDLSTAFASGPALRLSYRPNDPLQPFALSVRTGLGPLGSPARAPFAISAEFNLLSSSPPAFSLLFKPRIGDFSLANSVISPPASVSPAPPLPPPPSSPSHKLTDLANGDDDHKAFSFSGNGFAANVAAAGKSGGGVGALLSGMRLTTRSVLPLWSKASLRFQWGLRVPPELKAALADDGYGRKAGNLAINKLPLLVMNKITIEHTPRNPPHSDADKKGKKKDAPEFQTEGFSLVKRQLEVLNAESIMLRRAVEDLRAEIGGNRAASMPVCFPREANGTLIRHGTGSWDSVAMEVQTRSPLAARPGLTPTSCRLRFRHLHRRFSVGGAAEEEDDDEEAEEGGPDASAADGWMDELRRLRVAELRREVERCDLSIGTLQTKVKRLREEREQSIHGGGGEGKTETANGDERLSSEEPGRSCRESNSTDLKPAARAGDNSVKEEEDDEDEAAAAAAKQEASGESVAASKESSDLRSSASLRRRRRHKPGADEDADGEEASAPRPPSQSSSSQPLAALLDTFAARFGPLLERLHESQESDAYRGAIRRHVDIEMRGAAGEARALVSASLRLCEPKQEPGAAAAAVAAMAAAGGGGGGGAGIVGSLIEKGGKPLIVCRKRSSIAKAAAAAKKEESAEKGEVAEEGEGSDDGEKKVSVSASASKDKAWGLRTKKGRGPGKNSAAGGGRKMAKLSEATEAATDGGKKGDKKIATDAATLAKKRNAVDFLKRLNQGSSPSKKKKKGSPMGTRKRAAAAAATSPEQPQKTRKGPGRKDAGRGGSKKGGKSATPKRSVGRPPSKRGAAAATTPPPSKRAKVNRSEKTAAKRGGRR
uniref:Uncharacterized protein n=1 Tax=Oryza meridionalis TaxID=40149 RepID=A0A0E0ETK2_9ORYZ